MTIAPIKGVDPGFYITPEGMVLKEVPQFNSRGYNQANVRVGGKSKKITVHRTVASTFIPNPENKPQVNHINGIKTDNRAENLEWCTPQENAIHAHRIGLAKPPKKRVEMLSKDGRSLETFASLRDAADYLGKPKRAGSISRAAQGKQKTAYGYRWQYTKD